ncbi:MAG: hypothetical protein AB7E60_07450 [Sphingobium sp.]
MNNCSRSIALVALMTVFCIQPVQASSPDAWKEFQQNVEKACRGAVSGVLDVNTIQVDPYGSDSYGFALLLGTEVGTSTDRLIACAYNKESQAVEISSPLQPMQTKRSRRAQSHR